jgi:hypothetical protein
MKNLTTEYTENTERENDLQCELAAWELLREATQERDEARFLLKQAQSALDTIHLEVGVWIKTMKENTD